MSGYSNFSHQFLIAMPGMDDPNFAQSLTYVLHHDEDGAIGLVVNRPSDLSISQLLAEVQLPPVAPLRYPEAKVLLGGPVAQHVGFVLHRGAGVWTVSKDVGRELFLTSSRDILKAISQGQGPDDYLVALGYAGWGAGQLEQEMASNTWLNCPADERILFEAPLEERWQAAATSLGIDLRLLGPEVGHA